MIFNSSIIAVDQNQPIEATPPDPTYKTHLTPPYNSPVDIETPSPYFPALYSTGKFFYQGVCGKFFLCGDGGKFLIAENFSLPRLAEN
jgi:hypothetical protein